MNNTEIIKQNITNVDALKDKIAELCLEYANIGSTNNQAGSELFFKIQELTKALNAISNESINDFGISNERFKGLKEKYQFLVKRCEPINPFITEEQKENILKYTPLKNGYYWVRHFPHNDWEVMEYRHSCFVRIGDSHVLHLQELSQIGERIEHK